MGLKDRKNGYFCEFSFCYYEQITPKLSQRDLGQIKKNKCVSGNGSENFR